ncbi:zona pellucida sperm-binding protein 3 [Spinachia spinachia]
MKANWCLGILWSVLSLSCALDESPFRIRKRTKSKPPKQPGTRDRGPFAKLLHAAGHLGTRGPYPPPPPPPPPSAPRPVRPGGAEANIPAVSVTCSTAHFVVRVKPSFYGLGAEAEELKLGSSCNSNGVVAPDGDLLFTYPLTSCDAVRESPCGYLIYKFVLHYEPSPKRSPGRAHRMDVDIECRYHRNHHVYQLAVQPAWETTVVRKLLKGGPSDFLMELMDDSWSRPVKYQEYPIGKTINVQVSAPHLTTTGKVYINSCHATPSSGFPSSLKYDIIDNFGCMLDSKSDPGGSRFISRTDGTLRFSLKAFQFTFDPDTEVNIHCKVFVIAEDAGPTHKSCTYTANGWKALTGDDSACKCCDSQCASSKARRALMEGSASSGPLLISDQPHIAEDGLPPDGEATINHNDELKSDEDLWDSPDLVEYDYHDDQDYADEEDGGFVLGVMSEPEWEELGFQGRVFTGEKEFEVKDLNEFEEDGLEYVEEIDLNQKEAEVAGHWVKAADMFPPEESLHTLVSEGEEENGKHAGRGGGEDVWMASEGEWNSDEGQADLLHDGDMTWFFRWR